MAIALLLAGSLLPSSDLITTAVAATPAVATTVDPPAGIKQVRSLNGITEYRLDNGLTVLLSPDASKQTITVNMVYLVGSRHEGYGETGMAHLLEHLLFKGTPRHPNIPQELTEHGARPNGTTSFDRTNYYETFQATDANLEWALDLEADRMVNSFVAKKDLDSEMTVVRNEFEIGENNPQGVLSKRTLSTAFIWHNYGNSPIGAREDIENVPIERLQAFYRKYYQPDNATLIVTGKFEENKILGLIQKHFGAIAKPKRQLQLTYTAEPTQDGERIVKVQRVGDVQALLTIYHVAAGSHPDFAPLQMLTEVLGNPDAGRLKKALIDTKKATSAGGFTFQLREPGAALFSAEVRRENDLNSAQETLIKTVEDFNLNPATSNELERARGSLLRRYELVLNDPERLALNLSEWTSMGDWRLFFLHQDRLKAVTTNDITRVAKTYFKSSNRTIGQFIPTSEIDRAEIPPTPDIATMIKDYRGKEDVATGENFDPSPANIEGRMIRKTLSNGLKLLLLPKKTRGNTVNVALNLHFGDEQTLFNRTTAGSLVPDLLMRGTQKRTREQIKDELNRLKATMFVGGEAAQAFARIEAKRETLVDTVKLLTEVLREPAFPTTEFDLLKEEQLAAIERQRSEPTDLANQTLSRYIRASYPKGHPNYRPTFEESIQNLKATSLDDLKNFYRDFYGASHAELAIVGDFDVEATTKLLEQSLGNWQSGKPFKEVVTPYENLAPTNQQIETPDKASAAYFGVQLLKLRDTDPDYPAMVIANSMLGGGFLHSRLETRVRQKEGLSYTVFSSVFATSEEQPFGLLFVLALYAPENLARLEQSIREELDKVVQQGFTAEELAGAKVGYLQQRQVSRSQDNELSGRLAGSAQYNRTLAYDASLEEKIQNLTIEQVNATVRKYIDPSKFIIVKAGDFAKKKK
jgi:zinc protease